MIRNFTVLFVCFATTVGCNKSNNAEVEKEKARADTAVADAQSAKAELAKEKARADAAAAERAKEKARADIAEGELTRLQAAQAKPKPVDDDRRAAEWVLRVDGTVRVAVDGVPHEIKKGEKLPDGVVKLQMIELRGCLKATDDGREYLRGLSGLQDFRINNSAQIRNLDFLADMTGLTVLNTEGYGPLIADKDLAHLKRMTNLKTLVIASQVGRNLDLTDKVFAVVRELKQLETLRLCNCNITDEGVRQLDGHPSLRAIDFWLSTKVGDAGLASLASLPKLVYVGVKGTQVTDAGVKAFQASAPKCKVVFK